jgi:catechol 2,3-dioxygenase-like lactoylglutathione lyase family enzyme
MESVIAGLLKQFEDGKLTRRQLIQSLTLAAAAAVPGGAVLAGQAAKESQIPPPKDPTPWKTVYLDHISYAVSDYRRSTAFYRDLMGWTIANESANGNQCTMNIGNVGQIIIRNNRQGRSAETPAATAGAAQGGQANRPPLTGVINHVSWGIQPWDTDKVKAELDRRGLNPRPDMVGENFKSFHVLDPDGWDLQISNKIKAD